MSPLSLTKSIANANIFIFLAILFEPVHADDWASLAYTSGKGEIEIINNYFVITSSKYYPAQIPNKVKSGTTIQIKYKDKDNWKGINFTVAGISTSKNLCRLHSKVPSRFSSNPGDTIYVKPCRYK